jgi:hypothetical protein
LETSNKFEHLEDVPDENEGLRDVINDIAPHDNVQGLANDVGIAPHNVIEGDTNMELTQVMNQRYGPRNSQYDLRPRKPRDYSHLHTTLRHIALTQYSLKHGLETFGRAGVEAVRKE